MKLFSAVLFAGLVAFVCAQGQKGNPIAAFLKTCAAENGIDIETLKSAISNPNPDSKVKCTFSCVCKKLGIIRIDGSAFENGVDRLIKQLHEQAQALVPLAEQCLPSMKAGLPKCESAWLVAKCVISNMRKSRQS